MLVPYRVTLRARCLLVTIHMCQKIPSGAEISSAQCAETVANALGVVSHVDGSTTMGTHNPHFRAYNPYFLGLKTFIFNGFWGPRVFLGQQIEASVEVDAFFDHLTI